MPTTVDFVADFGAPTNGADCLSAVNAFNTYFSTHNDVILTVPAHTYNVSSSAILGISGAGASTLVINATGATFSNGLAGVWSFGSQIAQQTVGHEARINTVGAGSSSVVLVTPSQRTRFAVGRWVIVASLDVGENGQPSGQHYFEYAKVSNIAVDGTITFVSPLTRPHKSTYPLFYDGQPSEVDMGGPATIYDLPVAWDTDLTVNGLTWTNGLNQTYAKCRSATFNNCVCTGGGGLVPTVNKTHAWSGCDFSACTVESDKLIDAFTITNSSVFRIDVQSSCINTTTISGLTCGSGLNGTGRVTTVANSTIPTFRVGSLTHGVSDSIAISNCSITVARQQSDNYIDPSVLTWMGGGTFRATTANADSGGVRRAAVPGHKYRFAFYDGSIHDVDDLGGTTTFTVLDVRQDATYVYMDTNLTSLPAPTFLGGQAPTQYVAYAARQITQTGGSADMTIFAAPPNPITVSNINTSRHYPHHGGH